VNVAPDNPAPAARSSRSARAAAIPMGGSTRALGTLTAAGRATFQVSARGVIGDAPARPAGRGGAVVGKAAPAAALADARGALIGLLVLAAATWGAQPRPSAADGSAPETSN
jgi:hypothetical protein